MDARAQEILDFWLTRSGRTAGTAPIDALDCDDPRALGRRSGRPAAPAACASGGARRAPASRSSSCSTSSRATCSATTRAPSPATRGRSTVAKTAILHGVDRRIDAAGAAVLLHAARCIPRCRRNQDKAVRLFLLSFGRGELLRHARAHREIIRRFGRFPFRNAALGPREHAGGGGLPRRRRLPGGLQCDRSREPGGTGRSARNGLTAARQPRGRGEKRTWHPDIRRRRHRRRTGRLRGRDPRGAARALDRHRRAREPRRHLPELGLHPDQGAAPDLRDLPPDAPGQGVRAQGRERRLRPRRGGEALARASPSSSIPASAT